jgi:hypothetical protein
MKTNRALASYEPEYKRLFESLYEAHRLEDELTKKCKTLQVLNSIITLMIRVCCF